MPTFKEISKDEFIEIEVKKSGLSLGIIFSKEFLKRFDIKYGDVIRLDNAEIVKK